MSILHVPDPMDTDTPANMLWRPVQSVNSVLMSFIALLGATTLEDISIFGAPANVDSQVEFRDKPNAFKARVRKLVEKACSELPAGFEMPKPKAPVVIEDDDDMNPWGDGDSSENYDDEEFDEDMDEDEEMDEE
jgi:hypothetical protein